MIRVRRVDEPAGFDDGVRRRGQRALLELTGAPATATRPGPKRRPLAGRVEELASDELPDYWTASLPDLRRSYRHVCAYLGMYIDLATGLATVDHFKPKSRHQRLAYEWDNFRLAAHQIHTWLLHHCPFVARELRRQNRLRPGDSFVDP